MCKKSFNVLLKYLTRRKKAFRSRTLTVAGVAERMRHLIPSRKIVRSNPTDVLFYSLLFIRRFLFFLITYE